VLHVIETGGPGGAETVFRELARGLDSAVFRSFGVVPVEGWASEGLRTDGLPVRIIPSKRSADLGYLARIVQLVHREKIDIIQSHLLGANLYSSIVGAICGVPVIGTFHGQVDISLGDRLLRTKCRIINRADRLVFVSEHLRRYYCLHTPIERAITTCIYNGIDTARFGARADRSLRSELGLSDHEILIGALGNVRPAKGYDVLLRAVGLLKNEYPELRFVIVGDPATGELGRNLSELHRALGLGDMVRYAGFRRDVERVLSSFDIFVLPSRSEGFSIATLEAMACGLPVIVTRCGGPEEIVCHGEDGLVIDRDSPSAIAAALRHLVLDHQTRNRLGMTARQSVMSRFSKEAMIRQYTELYEQVVRHPVAERTGQTPLLDSERAFM
jgi:glycosyltransferase involved in cell wall biosynthesis